MYNKKGDEEGVIIKFNTFEKEVSFERNLSVRRIGWTSG